MATIENKNNRATRARELLERCGISANGLTDTDVLARAEHVVETVMAYQKTQLGALFDEHVKDEFVLHDVDATMSTMVDEPYVHNVPTMIGGAGRQGVVDFYSKRMIPKLPADAMVQPISRTVGVNQVVDELIVSFTHDREIDFMLPGIEPTGRRVELPHVVVVNFRGDKIHHEHIWWDQGSLLVQVGLLDGRGLPVAGAEATRAFREIVTKSS